MATLAATKTTTTTRLINAKACQPRGRGTIPAWTLSFGGSRTGAVGAVDGAMSSPEPTLVQNDPVEVTVHCWPVGPTLVGACVIDCGAGAFTGERMGVASSVDPRANAGLPNSA